MKKFVAIFLAVVLVICLSSSLAAVADEEDVFPAASIAEALPRSPEVVQTARNMALCGDLAGCLKALGLFRGVSDSDYDLDSAPTRAQTVVMLIRLLGEESEALDCTAKQPFGDVPAWAERYVAYAYEQGLAKGRDEKTFGAMEPAYIHDYLTLVLRALGYSDGENGDFTWEAPEKLAAETGILTPLVQQDYFLRADVALVSYCALAASMKDGGPLADSLIKSGVFTSESFGAYYDAAACENGKVADAVKDAVDELLLYSNLDDGLDITGMSISYKGAVCQVGDAAYELYATYNSGAKKCAQRVNTAATNLGAGARVFYLIAPNSLGVVPSEESRIKISSKADEKGGIDYSYGCLNELVTPVDALRELRAHNDEYVYFRTDHHWTGLGAYYAYRGWCKTSGFEPTRLSDYTALDMPGHLGYFYALCKSSAMAANPDCVTAYFPSGDFSVKVTKTNGAVTDGKLVSDYSSSAAKYGCFIGGDYPLEVITNNDPNATGTGVLVKDSFGNPFAVYMAQHYKTLYVLDYRYYGKLAGHTTLSGLEQSVGIDDVVVLLSMTLSQADSTASLLDSFLY